MAPSAGLDISCESCGATVRVEAHLRSLRCPYCDSPKVIERPASPDRPEPTFVVPFVVPERDAHEQVRRWLARAGLFAPSAFRKASPKKTRAVYLPAWLYGAVADSDFEVEIGEQYHETRTVRRGRSTHVETVTRTEWFPLRGRRTAYVRDVIVSASRGLPNDELEDVEPFELEALHRYEPALVSGWTAEEPSISADECREAARREALEEVARELPGFLPGDEQRGLRHQTRLVDEVADLVLLPLWVFALRWHEEKPPARILVNGRTGEVRGIVPKSGRRVAVAVVAALLGLAALVALIAWAGR